MQNYTPSTSIGGPLGTVLTLRYCPNTAFLKLLVLVGKRCDRLMLEKITNIVVQDIQVDEIWGYVFKKGKRDTVATDTFIGKLRYATAASRYQLTSDGFKPYVKAVQMLLRDRVDFAQLVKVYGTSREPEPQCIEHVGFDVGVTPIQIGLLLEEGVKVVLTRSLIELPG